MSKRWRNRLLAVPVSLLIVALIGMVALAWWQADVLVHHPPATRDPIDQSPADMGLPYEDITLTAADGVQIAGWYIPAQNEAAIIAVHGYKSDREEMLDVAAMLSDHGYGVLLIDLRTHGESGGELITFGRDEQRDVAAAYDYLLTRPEVAAGRIGAIGNSMGGVTVLLHAADNPGIGAVVANSAYASLQDEIATGVRAFTGLPPFPFAPLIRTFAQWQTGHRAAEVSAVERIGAISPRPVLILQGGADTAIPTDSGQQLYAAAGEPRTLWYEPDVGHVGFITQVPAAFERRIIGFFDAALLGA